MQTEKLREVLYEAARTASYDGGDRWLARELRRERARLGMSLRTETPEDFARLSLDVAKEFSSCNDYEQARKMLYLGKHALEQRDSDDIMKELDDFLIAVEYRGFSRAALRTSSVKRKERKERRMMWRNEITKRPLRRVMAIHSAQRVKRNANWYLLHHRINARAEATTP